MVSKFNDGNVKNENYHKTNPNHDKIDISPTVQAQIDITSLIVTMKVLRS